MNTTVKIFELIYPLAYYDKADIEVLQWMVEDVKNIVEQVITAYEENISNKPQIEDKLVRALHIAQTLQESVQTQSQSLLIQLETDKKSIRDNIDAFQQVESLSEDRKEDNKNRLNEEYKQKLRDTMVFINSLKQSYEESKKEVKLYIADALTEEFEDLNEK